MKSWKKGVAAASILVGLSVATLGIGFPTYAGDCQLSVTYSDY